MNSARMILAGLALSAFAVAAPVSAAPYPPVDQKRPPLVLQSHGLFWAGGKIVKRQQVGTFAAGDKKGLAYRDQEVLVGQAYVEYFIPRRLRHGKKTIPSC